MNDMHLVEDILAKDIVKEANRKGFGRGLLKAGQINQQVVAACADLTESTNMHLFAKEFPERFIEMGVAEQNLVTVGSGLAAMGKTPFVSSYAAFSPGRNWEQIRTTICLNDQPVKIVGSHAGISVGPDGATHQMLEDIVIMRTLPNMVVIAPGDSLEAEKAAIAMANDPQPNYMRLSRADSPVFTTDKTPFQIGKAYVLAEGTDMTIVSTGLMTYQALVAAEKLYKDGIDVEVVHVPTVKPLDEATILKSAKKTKQVMTIEEGQIAGGLGSAVTELLSEKFPVPVKRLGIDDHFGESGQPDELLDKFGLSSRRLIIACHQIHSFKPRP
jgi:transketolase